MAEIENTGNDTNVWKSWYVDEADQYANWSQDLITASRALHNQRKQLHKVMNHCEDIFERFTGNYDQTDRAKSAVENELMKLTRCTTYWCYMLLARKDIINWDAPNVSRFGIKPSMKYTEKRFLMNIDTIIDGHTYNWKADFHGHENFPKRLDDADDVQELLVGIKDRIHSYHEKIQSKMNKRQHQPRYQQQPHSNFHEQNLRDTLHLLKSLMEDLVEKMESDPDQLQTQERNSLHAQLGRRFHGDQDLAKVHEQDGDVTYNTKKQVYYRFDSNFQLESDYETNGRSNLDYTVEVFKHFPYRRNRGVHIDTENKKTIKWFNNVLPHVSRGWYEVVVTTGNQAYKIQLAPWERKNTTFVRPFALVSNESPVHSQNRLIDLNHKGFDFREKNLQDFEITRLTPYLIHGKGNDIDAMVHSLRVIDSLERNIQEKIDADVTWLADKIKEMPVIYGPLIQDQSLMQYMRAYFSSDAKTGVIGDRSVFFFNIQGVIVGVEMYAPSLPPYVDLQGRSGGYGKLPRNPRKHHKEDSSTAPEPSNAPHWYPPAPKAEVHVTGIPPEIMTFIEKASHKISDIEKYMQEHKAELPAQIERIVREATKDITAARSAIEYEAAAARQASSNPWLNRDKPLYDPFKSSSQDQQPQDVHAAPAQKQDPSTMKYDELQKHNEKMERKQIMEKQAREQKEEYEKRKYKREAQRHTKVLTEEELEEIDGEKIKSDDFPSNVEGHYNEMYQLQLYPRYREGIPKVDIAGLVPEKIKISFNMKYTDTESNERMEKEYYGQLSCIDSTVPVYKGEVRITQRKHNQTTQERDCTLYITRHLLRDSNGIAQRMIWGMKGKIKGSAEKIQLIAYRDPNSSDQFLIGNGISQRWIFSHNLDMQKIPQSDQKQTEIKIENTIGDMIIRAGNQTVREVPENKKSELNDEYQPLSVEELKSIGLYGLSKENLDKTKAKLERLKEQHRVNKIILYTFSQEYKTKLIQRHPDLAKSLNVFSCPKFLRMSSAWLNEKQNLDPKVSDPANSNMCLVDLQGPVYVSQNGRFMVSPTLAKKGETKAITWGIFIWNSNLAEYEIMAYKLSGKQSQFLINDRENTTPLGRDLELGVHAENYWIQFIRFDGTPAGEVEQEEVQLINFYLPDYDTNMPSNPYHMHPRFPDYTISQAEHNILAYKAQKTGREIENGSGEEKTQPSTEAEFEECTPFHEANMLALEAIMEHHWNGLGAKQAVKQYKSGTGPAPVNMHNFTFRRPQVNTSHAQNPPRFRRMFRAPWSTLQVYRTYRLESNILDYNPWESVVTTVLKFVYRFLASEVENLGNDEEMLSWIEEEQRKIERMPRQDSNHEKTTQASRPQAYDPHKKRILKPNQGQGQKRYTRAEFSDDTDDYLLRQCFDDQPAAQRLPAQPRKLAAPVRTFAPWKPPAAGVSW